MSQARLHQSSKVAKRGTGGMLRECSVPLYSCSYVSCVTVSVDVNNVYRRCCSYEPCVGRVALAVQGIQTHRSERCWNGAQASVAV